MALGMRGAERQDSARAALDSAGTHGHAHPRPALDHRGVRRGPQSRPAQRPAARRGRPVRLAARLGGTIRAELDGAATRRPAAAVAARRCAAARRATAVARRVGGDPRVEVHAGLLEIDYGAWDGLTAGRVPRSRPRAARRLGGGSVRHALPGGRERQDVAARISTVLDPLEAWLAEDRARVAIVVAHNHVNRLRLCALFGWPMREYRDRLSQHPAGTASSGSGRDAGGPPPERRAGLRCGTPCVGTAEPEP